MRKTLVTLLTVAVSLPVVSNPVLAHHANAIFDLGKKVTVTGTVTEWFWANPHCLLRLDVKDDSGQVVHWTAETQAPPNMIPFGWTKQSFKSGDQVTITLEPVKNGSPLGRILQARLADGTTLVPNASPIPDGAASGAPRP